MILLKPPKNNDRHSSAGFAIQRASALSRSSGTFCSETAKLIFYSEKNVTILLILWSEVAYFPNSNVLTFYSIRYLYCPYFIPLEYVLWKLSLQASLIFDSMRFVFVHHIRMPCCIRNTGIWNWIFSIFMLNIEILDCGIDFKYWRPVTLYL